MVYTLGNFPSNFNAGARGKGPTTSSSFLNNSIERNALDTSTNENAAKNDENTPLHPPWNFVNLQKKLKKWKKAGKTKHKTPVNSLPQYLVVVA